MFLASRSFRSLRSRKNAMTALAEAGAHLGQIDGRDVDESALSVKASLQEQAVPMGIPASELS
jgi:hypothetical protein